MRLGLLFLPVLVLTAGCGSTDDSAQGADAPEVIAAVPDCTSFNLKERIATTHDSAPSYQCVVSTGLSRSSQPDDGWIKSLADPTIRVVPFRSVVNLRGEDGANGEDPVVRRFGMTPLNIRVIDMTAPTRDQVVQFLGFATRTQNQPALVHCHAGQGRTGTFVAAYRMAVQGWKSADAIGEAQAFNANGAQVAFLEDFAKHLDDPDIRAFRDAPGGTPFASTN